MMQPETSPLGIAALRALLQRAEIDLDAEQIADILWLAVQMAEVEESSSPETPIEEPQTAVEIEPTTLDSPLSSSSPQLSSQQPTASEQLAASEQPAASAYLPSSIQRQSQNKTIPFQVPVAPALRNPLALARALRPLMRKVSSQIKTVLDEEETVTQIAEKEIWIPVLKPAPERWLELALVVEESRSTAIWQEIIAEFQKLAELQGAFRDVRTWSLTADSDGAIQLFPRRNLSTKKQRSRSPKELLDPAGRRLILLISDCISPIWRQGKIHDLLKLWSKAGCVAIVQLLPERLWVRTALGAGFPVQLSALSPGVANAQLIVDGLPVWEDIDITKAVTLPVVTLEPDSLKQWSRVVAGAGSTQTTGISFDLSLVASLPQTSSTSKDQLSAAELVKRFRTTASPTARRLAGLMSAVPVSLPVVYLIQETLLPESMQVHVAEVFMSGLLQPLLSENANSKSETIQYEFVEGVRELLLDSVPIPDVEDVLEAVSQYIARKAGLSIKNFAALLSLKANCDQATEQALMPFAQITTQVLRRLGGEYAALAEQLERSSQVPRKLSELSNVPQAPPLQTFEFEVATITIAAETETSPEIQLKPFEFEVATIEKQLDTVTETTKLVVQRHQRQAWSFTEDLENGIELEMVAIPEGEFVMGSPEDEPERSDSESPQRTIIIQSFFLSKYPITQAQWKAVTSLPQLNRELDPAPSIYQGANHPVETVSWLDAVEFCDRLTQKTGRQYRLASEAEWEYACRGGTITPFHFGDTITPELANYNGERVYATGSTGTYRRKPTPVGSFAVANAFGLYDMHGNVWEWCADDWHSNYEEIPTDGRAWVDSNEDNNKAHVLRGGSFVNYPKNCRSACRYRFYAGYKNYDIGFRVACDAAIAL